MQSFQFFADNYRPRSFSARLQFGTLNRVVSRAELQDSSTKHRHLRK